MKLLVTGAAGFIGSTFLRTVRERHPDWELVVLDALTYAGNLSTIQDLNLPFCHGKIQDEAFVAATIKKHNVTHIVNFAAESHNDRSMLETGSFILSNTLGVHVLLEATRKFGLEKMVHVSTDEVYGTIDEGQFTEESPLEPNTPYSASKAGGDLQVRAHVKAYRTPAVITRGGNTYGPYQFPEKLISFFATRLIDGKKVPVYGVGDQIREWIHARDHAAGVLTVLERGACGEIYNIGDANERRNMEIVEILLQETGRDKSLVKRIPDPRQGAHDKRYSMSTAKIRALGWKPEMPFEQELRNTVRWYVENEWWWRPLVETDDYRGFIGDYYGKSLGEDL
ncbi:MAG TPA: dTDP-glucose 4,6-dehydratase [Fimbriimonadaceae bacterium]|nr:dTDP-glucose 4,6-dehydratase [Fimbriimonadaceae bacterium]